MPTTGFQPPLFPSQEPDAAVLSALAFVHQCCRTWKRAEEALARASRRTKANSCCPLHMRSEGMAVYQGPTSPGGLSQVHWAIIDHQGVESGGGMATSHTWSGHPVFQVSRVKSVFRSCLNPSVSVPTLSRVMLDTLPVWFSSFSFVFSTPLLISPGCSPLHSALVSISDRVSPLSQNATPEVPLKLFLSGLLSSCLDY